MSQESIGKSPDVHSPKAETLAFDEQGLVSGVSNLLDSLESNLPALALKGVEDSKMSWNEFRNLADKIPDVGRGNIGRYSDFITGERKKGLAERSLAYALDEQVEKLISGGIDLQKTRDRLVALEVPHYVLSGLAKSAMRISPDQAGPIATVFEIKD